MEIFAKQIEQQLFKALDCLQSAIFLLCREKDIFVATANGVLKVFHQNIWKTSVKELIFF